MTQIKIHGEVYGRGPREIVICNGLSQSTANWRGIARMFPEYRWILFDARGHGKSDVPPGPYHLDDHVADLKAVLDQFEANKPVLMGFSHGARVALRAAAEYGDRFGALILVSVGVDTGVKRRAYLKSWAKCLELGGVEAMAWSSLPAIVGRKILHKFDDLEMLVKGSVTRNHSAGLSAVFAGQVNYPPMVEDARRVQLPTLVLRGGEDPLVGEEDLAQIADWIVSAETGEFQDCGHTLPLEEPHLFLEKITGFMNKWIR